MVPLLPVLWQWHLEWGGMSLQNFCMHVLVSFFPFLFFSFCMCCFEQEVRRQLVSLRQYTRTCRQATHINMIFDEAGPWTSNMESFSLNDFLDVSVWTDGGWAQDVDIVGWTWHIILQAAVLGRSQMALVVICGLYPFQHFHLHLNVAKILSVRPVIMIRWMVS